MPAALTSISTSTRSARRQRERREAQRVEMAALAGFEAQRHRGIEPLLARRTAAVEALDVASFAAEGDFALRVVPQEFAPEQSASICERTSGGRSIPRQRRFECSLRMTRNNPMAGACATAVASPVPPRRLRAARHEIDAKLGHRHRSVLERLGEVEQGVGAHQRRTAFRRRVQSPKINDALAAARLRHTLQEAAVQSSGALGTQRESVVPVSARNRCRGARRGIAHPMRAVAKPVASPSPEASAKMSHEFLRATLRASPSARIAGSGFFPGFAREQADLSFTARRDQSTRAATPSR